MPFDAAIIGAGPAGAWAARSLAAQGARVALIDASHPREKPCGGGLTGRALDLVAGAIGTPPLASTRITHARFIGRGPAPDVTVGLSSGSRDASLEVFARQHLDARLLQAAVQAGATHIDARTLDLAPDDTGWRIHLRGRPPLLARVVIGADGANSLVRRRVAAPFSRADLSMSVGVYAHGVTSSEIVLDILDNPPGYVWSFPRPDHLAIGVCTQADLGVSAADLRRLTLDWVHRTGVGDGARLEPYAWPMPSLREASLRALRVSGPSWFLVGDAAGLVDPITREGIYFALASGQWAADALAAGGSAARDYQQRVHAEIVCDLVRAARYKHGFFDPRFADLFVRALARPRIAEVMAHLAAGRQPYAGLKRRLLATCEWGLAWEALRARRSRRAPER